MVAELAHRGALGRGEEQRGEHDGQDQLGINCSCGEPGTRAIARPKRVNRTGLGDPQPVRCGCQQHDAAHHQADQGELVHGATFITVHAGSSAVATKSEEPLRNRAAEPAHDGVQCPGAPGSNDGPGDLFPAARLGRALTTGKWEGTCSPR